MTNASFSASIFALALALLAPRAHAEHIEKWQGTGAEYTPSGQQLATYDIVVVNTAHDKQVIHSEATITTSQGKKHVYTQILTMKENRWSNDSSLGKGGGACYGPDMCENYIENANGRAYATTIAIDSATSRRNLTVVLQNGKALKVLREKLVRAN